MSTRDDTTTTTPRPGRPGGPARFWTLAGGRVGWPPSRRPGERVNLNGRSVMPSDARSLKVGADSGRDSRHREAWWSASSASSTAGARFVAHHTPRQHPGTCPFLPGAGGHEARPGRARVPVWSLPPGGEPTIDPEKKSGASPARPAPQAETTRRFQRIRKQIARSTHGNLAPAPCPTVGFPHQGSTDKCNLSTKQTRRKRPNRPSSTAVSRSP